jgi:hypothetical protein
MKRPRVFRTAGRSSILHRSGRRPAPVLAQGSLAGVRGSANRLPDQWLRERGGKAA